LDTQQCSPAIIRLAALDRSIPLARICQQLYAQLERPNGSPGERPRNAMVEQRRHFPFGVGSYKNRPWRPLGDFRDSIMANLPQTPPSDVGSCAEIKRALADDLDCQRRMYLKKKALCVADDDLALLNKMVTHLEQELAALSDRPLSQFDMAKHARLEIKARIRQMLDADATSGRLIVNVLDDKQVVMLDALVAWAVRRKIKVEQEELPGCPSLVTASYQRLLQLPSDDAMVTTSASSAPQQPSPAERRRGLDITTLRGVKRRILENWDDIEKLHGPNPTGIQVLRILKRDEEEKNISIKSVQNRLSRLRNEGLIP